MRYIKLDEKWLNKLRETAHFFSADIVCGAGTDWVLKTAEAQNKTLFDIISYLENAPSEDVAEVKHGRWIKQKPDADAMRIIHAMGLGKGMSVNSIYWTCSVCENWGTPHHKYCCSCGAKMDGGSETKNSQESLWEKNMEMLRNGDFGSMAGNECFNTLLRYWQAQEQAGYPKANENVKYFKKLVERNENGK